MPFKGSYVWKVRQKYGHNLLLLPAASVIVERDDGAILLMKRVDTGNWSIIGGYAEENAGFRQTALTELAEEAAVSAKDEDLIPYASLSNPQTNTVTYPNGDNVHVFLNSFVVRKWQKLEQPLDEAEVLELGFFKLDELPENIERVTQVEINAYKEYLRTGEFQSW